MTKLMAIPLFILLGCAQAWGQVTCSPGVDKEMCTNVNTWLPPLLHSVTSKQISVTVVTPDEYKQQLIDFGEREVRETTLQGGEYKAMNCPTCFSVWYRHTLANAIEPDITFIRHSANTAVPDSILISSDAFCGRDLYTVKDDPRYPKGIVRSRSTGKEDPERVSAQVNFILGYFEGATSTWQDHTGAQLLIGTDGVSHCKDAPPGSVYREKEDAPMKVCGSSK